MVLCGFNAQAQVAVPACCTALTAAHHYVDALVHVPDTNRWRTLEQNLVIGVAGGKTHSELGSKLNPTNLGLCRYTRICVTIANESSSSDRHSSLSSFPCSLAALLLQNGGPYPSNEYPNDRLSARCVHDLTRAPR